MDIVKKNVASLIFGVIALIAVVLAFYPMNGKFDEINKLLDERAKKYSLAEGILKKSRLLPEVDLVSTSAQKPLNEFPSPKITAMAKGFMDQLISQSRGVLETAVQINQNESVVGAKKLMLLTPDSLPEPKNNADNIFKSSLQPEFDALRLKVLMAGNPPTEDEIKKEQDKLLAQHQSKRILGADGIAINEQAVQDAYQKDLLLLPAKMRADIANRCRIYVDPEVISAPREIISAIQSPSPTVIWYTQAALWVQEDVCRAISEVNGSGKNVQESPIKRLVSLTIPPGSAMYVRADAAPADGAARGAAGADTGAPSNADPARNFTISPTGRASNNMYDVISFSLVLHVDQTKIPAILKQLSKDRFISVRNFDLTRLDTTPLVELGYVYGSAPIAEITLDCEAIQMREWTTPLMPRVIKDALIGAGLEFQSQLKPADKPLPG